MKKIASRKALFTGFNYFFCGGEMANMNLNVSGLVLLFMFNTKSEQDKRQKEEKAAKLANGNFCPPALILTCKFLSCEQTSKMCSISAIF